MMADSTIDPENSRVVLKRRLAKLQRKLAKMASARSQGSVNRNPMQQRERVRNPARPRELVNGNPARTRQPVNGYPARPREPVNGNPAVPRQPVNGNPAQPRQPVNRNPAQPRQPVNGNPARAQEPFNGNPGQPQNPVNRNPARPRELVNENPVPLQFSNATTVSEPNIPVADPILAEHGIKCQRFGTTAWENIHYADVQRNFEATAPFRALKANAQFWDHIPKDQNFEHLERADKTLAAITHGLLLQRQALEEAFRTLSPQAKMEFKAKVLVDTKFRKITDDLFQYTCGRRAQLIKTRRQTYKSRSKTLNKALHDIPPSSTHLFSEEKLCNFVEAIGGPNNLHLRMPKNGKKSKVLHRLSGNRKPSRLRE